MNRLSAVLIALMFASCGDPLIDGNFRGDPLYTISGTITVGENASSYASESTRVAVLWIGSEQQELSGQGLSQSSFPARYELTIYSEPVMRARQKIPNSQYLYAVARVVLYQDVNGNEQLDPGEPLTGGAEDRLIAFFPETGSADVVGGSFNAGFSTMTFLPCEEREGETMNTFMTPSAAPDVDLALTGEISTTLSDIDCDFIVDDLCLQTLQALEANPEDQALLAFYNETCVQHDPRDDEALNNATDVNNNPDNNATNNQPTNNDPNGEPICPGADSNDVENVSPDLFEICQNERLQLCAEHIDQLRNTTFIESWDSIVGFTECIGAYNMCHDFLADQEASVLSLDYAGCIYQHFQIEPPQPECNELQGYIDGLEQSVRQEAFQAMFLELCDGNG